MSDNRIAPVFALAANPDGNITALPGAIAYRSPPSNVEAEQALLGAVMVNNDCFHQLSSFLEPIHFYDPVHARIFEAICKLIQRGLLASPVTLKNYFDRDEGLAEIGGTQYLARLAASATTVINAEFYGRIIHDLSIRRGLIRLGEDVVNRSYDAPVDVSAASQIEEAESSLFNMAERGRYEGGLQPFKMAITQSIDVAAKADGRAHV